MTLTVIADLAPVSNAQSRTLAEDSSTSLVLTGSDPEGASLTFVVAMQPAHGVLSGTAPNLTYTPAANFAGTDTFTFKSNDGRLDSPVATVTLVVTPVNDAPIASAQSVTTDEDTALPLVLSAIEPDGEALTYTVVLPAHGALSGAAPNLTYTPVVDFHGADSFTFKVSDGTLESAVVTISITVTPVNDAPVAAAQSLNAGQSPTAVTLTGTDVDGDALTFALVNMPASGSLTGTPPNVTFTPAQNFAGVVTFTFTVADAALTSTPATVTLTVVGPPMVAASA